MNAQPASVSPLTRSPSVLRLCVVLACLAAGVHGGTLETRAGGAEPPVAAPAAGDERPLSREQARQLAALAARLRDFRARKDWENVAATHEKLLELDPKSVSFRRFVAWDLSYNISAEAVDVGRRYKWIRRGILVLIDGIGQDNKEAVLWYDAGWVIAQKIGRSDERRQLRRLFAADEELHRQIGQHVPIAGALGPDGKPDNWLVGRLFFLRAIDLVDREGATLGDMSPWLYRPDPGMCRIYFAEALAEQGHFGPTAVQAWREAEQEWRQLGNRELATSFGISIRLNEQEKYVAEAARLWKQFDQLQPGLRDRLLDEAAKALSDPQRRALETPPERRTAEQWDLAVEAESHLRLSPERLSESVGGGRRTEALRVGRQALAADQRVTATKRYGVIVNFEYWLRRCRIEPSEVVLRAREVVFRAQQQVERGRLDSADPKNPGARQLYEQGFRKWAEAFAQFKDLIEDENVCADVVAAVGRYRGAVLKGKPLPDDFPLREVVNRWDRQRSAD